MNQKEERESADLAIKYALDCVNEEDLPQAAIWSRIALVHATLATIPDPPEVRPRSLQTADGFCACSYLSYQHRVTPMCNTTPMPPPPVMDEKVKAAAERGRDRMIAEGRVIGSVPSDGPGQ